MNIEEAINAALEYENRVYDVYNDNAKNLKSATAQKIFAVLAREEQDHVEYLKAKLIEWEESGKITSASLGTIVPDKNALEENIKKLKKVPAEKDLSDEVKVFQKALEVEVETSKFYRELVGELSSEDQKLFEPFIEIEEAHEMIVRSEIHNAKKLGFWFDFMEFRPEGV